MNSDARPLKQTIATEHYADHGGEQAASKSASLSHSLSACNKYHEACCMVVVPCNTSPQLLPILDFGLLGINLRHTLGNERKHRDG